MVCPHAPQAAAPRLELRLAAVAALPDGAQAALQNEVQRLWQRAGIRVEWAETGRPDDAAVFRVLVVSRTMAAGDGAHTWPVAELLHDTEGRPVALASIDAAEKVLAVAHATEEPARMRHHRLGLVLGRAVAHEVGHRLLGTAHGALGLMRARIGAAEFADLRDGGFELDRVTAAAAVAAVPPSRPRIAALDRDPVLRR